MTAPLTVRTITAEEHLGLRGVPPQRQLPADARLGRGQERLAPRVDRLVRRPRSGELVGAGLVLYRQLPRVRRYLAYLPEGPVIDWDADDLADWLDPDGRAPEAAEGVRHPDGPAGRHPPLGRRRRSSRASPTRRCGRLDDVPPTERDARGARVVSQLPSSAGGCRRTEGGFAAGQPQLQLPDPAPRRRTGPPAPRTTCSRA